MPGKGQWLGECGRDACASPRALWMAQWPLAPAYFCRACALDVNKAYGGELFKQAKGERHDD